MSSTFKAIEMMRIDKGGKGGVVLNVSSIGALSQHHIVSVYSATKSAVLQFSNCIGVRNCCLFMLNIILLIVYKK